MLIYDPVYDENLLSGQPPLSGHFAVPESGRSMDVQLGHVDYFRKLSTVTSTKAIV